MSSLSRGFRLASVSWQVVRQDRELLLLPIVSFLCSIVVIAVFVAGMWGSGLIGDEEPGPVAYALGFVMYVALSFVAIFFNAAVIGTAMRRLQGHDARLSDGLQLARSHVGQIFVWAVITATVGMVLRSIQERAGLLGRIAIGLVGVAWNLITFFVVPVLLYENLGVVDAIKRSGSIFRRRWGEQVTGQATIGLAMFVIAIPVVLVGFLVASAVPALGIPLMVIAVGALMAAGAACSGVFNAALYRYAISGEISGGFSEADLAGTFRPKKGSGLSWGGDPQPPTRPDL